MSSLENLRFQFDLAEENLEIRRAEYRTLRCIEETGGKAWRRLLKQLHWRGIDFSSVLRETERRIILLEQKKSSLQTQLVYRDPSFKLSLKGE